MGMPKRLLLVDDEPSIVKGLKFSLEQDDYEVEVAYDGDAALDMFAKGEYDLILLDVMLPKKDGIEVCQQIRETSQVPIIMLTAKGEDMDKILGLEYGADDYMTKPFNILEVKARIKTILRRVSQPQLVRERHIATVGDLTVNFDQRAVFIEGKDANLTAREFDILQLLITNPGKVFNREQLRDMLWKEDYTGDLRTVDVHIRRLREKIEKNPSHPEYILTKWSVGYYFADQ
jgi:DNA-binding response OmpR family regulator